MEKIKIIACKRETYWYKNRIGKTFKVYEGDLQIPRDDESILVTNDTGFVGGVDFGDFIYVKGDEIAPNE